MWPELRKKMKIKRAERIKKSKISERDACEIKAVAIH